MALETAEPLETLHDAFWPTSSLPGIIPPKFLYGFPIYMQQVKTFCVKHLTGSVTPEEIWKDDPGFDGYWCAMASEYLTKEVGCPVVVTIALSALDTSYIASMADTYSLKDKGHKRPTEEHCDKLVQLLYGDKSGEARVKWHLDMQFCEWR
ncbi:hypothetical protein EWM64_g6158 [Hericium alpestre]|uniref:Uncharacterized protein n=1 Tax=Hericium alpestre TaxID=135208 RepID=A0A4Y9ZUZ0_9AGAM|nr:hypothetical protein EWM64_g6158 [Hericium alpestre]